MDREETDREFVVVDDDPGTDFVIVEEEPPDAGSRRDDELVAVPDADARYPGLVPVESPAETGFVIVEDESVGETGFRIVEDERDDDIVPVRDTALVTADEADLVPVDDGPDAGVVPDPFTPDLFRPDGGS